MSFEMQISSIKFKKNLFSLVTLVQVEESTKLDLIALMARCVNITIVLQPTTAVYEFHCC